MKRKKHSDLKNFFFQQNHLSLKYTHSNVLLSFVSPFKNTIALTLQHKRSFHQFFFRRVICSYLKIGSICGGDIECGGCGSNSYPSSGNFAMTTTQLYSCALSCRMRSFFHKCGRFFFTALLKLSN